MAKKDDKRPPHTGSVAPEDPALSTWLHKRWSRGELPQRIEVYQAYGKNLVRGEMIHHEDFKPSDKYDAEMCNKLANDIIEAAQHDCDSTPRAMEMNYLIVVKDNNRTATPLTRRLGPIMKKRELLENLRDSEDEDDEEVILGGKALSLKYITGTMAQLERDKQSTNNVIGELMILLKDRGDRAEARADSLMNRVEGLFDKWQLSEDRKADRDVMRQNAEFNLFLKKEGVRTVRNLLPSLFAAAKEGDGDQTALTTTTAPSNGNGNNGSAVSRDYGPSDERTQLDNFMHDIEEADGSSHPGLAVKLFGDYERGPNGERVEKAKGIFSFEQVYILVGVRAGKLPPDALDKLIPKAPHEPKSGLEITPEQITAAGNAGVSQGMGMALAEIVGLRNVKKQAAQAAAQKTTTASEAPQ